MASETWLWPILSYILVVWGRSVSGNCSATFHRSESSSCCEAAPCGKVPCGKGSQAGQGCTSPAQRSPFLLPHSYFPLLYPPLTGVNKASWRPLQSTMSSVLGMVRILFCRIVWEVKDRVGNEGREPGGCDALGWLPHLQCPPHVQMNGPFQIVFPVLPLPVPSRSGDQEGMIRLRPSPCPVAAHSSSGSALSHHQRKCLLFPGVSVK